jgi:mannobiose 2-epimerase
MKDLLNNYKKEQEAELSSILHYWMRQTPDLIHGGYYGKIDISNKVYPEAPKGSVLNARILWSFSAAFNLTGNKDYLEFADRAYQYIINQFMDQDAGGMYWSVDYTGKPLETKKQVYALAFALYGISEYVKTGNNEEAKQHAISLYHAIEKYSHDLRHGGYIEALTKDWQPLQDLRLSEKDANAPKSMNTHLHVLEAYSTLYKVWPSPELEKSIQALIRLFTDHIINPEKSHLVLFFDNDWRHRSGMISYGHDIEAAWLVPEAAEGIGNSELAEEAKQFSFWLINGALEGIDEDGGLWYEYNMEEQHLVKEKHWWPQAEAMVGFFNAWQITNETRFLDQSIKSWSFIKNHILDKRGGEWIWGVRADYSVMADEDKVGLWKCPYHNSRACIEIIKRCNSSIAAL